MKNMTQEATETLSQTKAEAAKGDQQAIRKLAKQQQQAAANPANTSPPPQKAIINSDNGQLDVKA